MTNHAGYDLVRMEWKETPVLSYHTASKGGKMRKDGRHEAPATESVSPVKHPARIHNPFRPAAGGCADRSTEPGTGSSR